MNTSSQVVSFVEKPLTHGQTALFLCPFVLFMLSLLPLQANWLTISSLGMLGLVLLIAILGLVKNLPRWALPSLGLVLGTIKIFTTQMIYNTSGVQQLYKLLWTDFILLRVLYVLIMTFLQELPVVLVLVAWAGLALLVARHPVLSGWRHRLGQDWTLLPFILYVTNLLTPLYNDVYHGLNSYELVFTLILVAGAWPFLRASQPWTRMAAMLIATLLAGGVLTLGIYQIYPFQEWVLQGHSSFPRWWETMNPLLNTLVLLVALGMLAVLGLLLRYKESVEAFTKSTV